MSTSRSMTAIYNPALQSGAGFKDWVSKAKQAHDFVKKGGYITKIGNAVDALGATDYLDSKTGGKYSQGRTLAKQKGYGKRKPGRPRKVGRPKKK